MIIPQTSLKAPIWATRKDFARWSKNVYVQMQPLNSPSTHPISAGVSNLRSQQFSIKRSIFGINGSQVQRCHHEQFNRRSRWPIRFFRRSTSPRYLDLAGWQFGRDLTTVCAPLHRWLLSSGVQLNFFFVEGSSVFSSEKSFNDTILITVHRKSAFCTVVTATLAHTHWQQ